MRGSQEVPALAEELLKLMTVGGGRSSLHHSSLYVRQLRLPRPLCTHSLSRLRGFKNNTRHWEGKVVVRVARRN